MKKRKVYAYFEKRIRDKSTEKSDLKTVKDYQQIHSEVGKDRQVSPLQKMLIFVPY